MSGGRNREEEKESYEVWIAQIVCFNPEDRGRRRRTPFPSPAKKFCSST